MDEPRLIIYGANGFVGAEIARLAVQQGLQPVIAGRDADQIASLAAGLGMQARVFGLEDASALDQALRDVRLVLHCAGPYIHTYRPMAEACLRAGAHYLDITGELPVYAALAERDAEARERGVMLLPGVGFDVVPTDCLALHLKQRLPTATHLALAFSTQGPARMPPGTARTLVTMLPYGIKIRRDGRLVDAPPGVKTRMVDFGSGPRQVTRLTWGDVFTAWHSTGIPNIEDYTVLTAGMAKMLQLAVRLGALLRLKPVRALALRTLPSGSTPEARARTRTHVWGEASDDQGRRVTARLHGPEAGVEWTARCALASVRRVLEGVFEPGYQTPGRVFGADFVLETGDVTREDLD